MSQCDLGSQRRWERLTLYLRSEEGGRILLRPVAKGGEAVERMMTTLELGLEAGVVRTRQGDRVGFVIFDYSDFIWMREKSEEAGLPVIILDTPR